MKHYTQESDIKQILKQRRKDKRADIIGFMVLGFVLAVALFHFVGMALYWVINN